MAEVAESAVNDQAAVNAAAEVQNNRASDSAGEDREVKSEVAGYDPKEEKKSAAKNVDPSKPSDEQVEQWKQKAREEYYKRQERRAIKAEEAAKREAQARAEIEKKFSGEDKAPDMAKYDDWDKYQADLIAYHIKKATGGGQQEQQRAAPSQQDLARQQYIAQVAPRMAERKAALLSENPNIAPVLDYAGQVIDNLPVSIQNELLKAADPIVAAVVLAQEGTLSDLAEMSPTLAARHIAAAVEKFKSQHKAESKAPAPLKAPRAVAQKSHELSEEEFRKKYLSNDVR